MTKEQMAALAAAFPEETVRLRAIAFNRDKTQALAASYVDPRAIAQRLDDVCPGWTFDLEIVQVAYNHAVVKGTLTLAGIARSDVGESRIELERRPDGSRTMDVRNDPWKSAASDAFKRCAVLFGVGRYLYQLPLKWLPWDAQRNEFRPRAASNGVAAPASNGAAAGAATEKQIKLIMQLYEELNELPDRDLTGLQRSEASALIDELIARRSSANQSGEEE